ncbi:MAG: S8 family serine peptidase, partial [Prevotellaceae bacterium]|nr:S8 family serine peptidase [Prevotellaceae bacterium]
MKKLIIILCFGLSVIYVNGQDFYMYVNGTQHFYETSATKMLIQSEMLDTISMKNAIQGSITGQIQRIYQLNDKLAMIDLKDVSKGTILRLQEQWNDQENVIYTSPILLDSVGAEIGGITNQVLIRLKSIQDYSLLINSITTYNIQSVKLYDFDERTYLLTIDKSSNKDAMQIANELYESGMFEYAEPNLIHFIKFETTDTYFSDQWALNNTGQYGGTAGIDIKANQAWTITAGSPDVRIAILDLGVDLIHPDLQANLLTGFDATNGSGNGAAVNNLPHGTACAGIAAAVGNNNEGIAGVAYGCNILPVRIATTNSGWTTTESQYIVSGIDWARTNGAGVISMSFTCIETTALNTSISNAITFGRNNNGCVLVAATGNDNLSTVSYPARHANVIAVGANTRNGQRASFSNYGTMLDVVAPGVDIYTTDIQGSSGYVTGDYHASFNGTSAACPHVAGVAALILSVRPDLTQSQVRQAIESTCTKLSGYSFSSNSNHPNGTWNNQVGHGLVNAYAALQAVLPPLTISGASSLYSFQQSTYTISNLPTNTTVTWSGSSNVNIVSGQGTSQVTVSICGGEEATLTATLSGSTINDTVSKHISLYQPEMTLKIEEGMATVSTSYPYAQCYDWHIGSDFQNSGQFNCYGTSMDVSLLSGHTTGNISVRAKSGNCYTAWHDQSFYFWTPEIGTGYYNPLRPEPFYANLVENIPGYVSHSDILFYWYFDNTLFDITYDPYIESHDWPCGEHQLRVVARYDGNIESYSTPVDFWGMCSNRYSSAYSAAYPNPAGNELIIDREETNSNGIAANAITGEQNAQAK